MTSSVGNFSHNFCESRIFVNKPEIFNSVSSLFIVIVPFFFQFPRNMSLKRVIFILMLNGLASSYYHYHLSWFGKQLDEITMIFALYIGTNEIKNVICVKNKRLYYAYDFYIITMICINTIPSLNHAFPIMYFLGINYLLYNIYCVTKLIPSINAGCLKFSFIGFICWVLSEIFCNKYLFYGHALWHFLFPLGFINFIENLDRGLLFRHWSIE